MTIPIPPYVPSFKPVPQVTPFTYRDGITMLKKLEGLTKYVNRVIVPFVNASNEELANGVQTDINNMLDLVNAAIAEIINSSINVQDSVVAGIFNNPTSATRVKTDALYAAKSAFDAVNAIITSGRLSQVALDNAYAKLADFNALSNDVTLLKSNKADKTYVDTQITAVNASLSGVSNRVTSLETLTQSGRLSGTAMDARYQLVPPPVHAVFIGSSNSTPGTWVEAFCADMNYIGHNFSIGGGSFTGGGGGAFNAQVDNAIADTSFDKALVKYFFICDLGNDMRATNSISAVAPGVLSKIASNYPNARIVVLPAVWGNASDNNIGGRLVSISARYQEIINACIPFNADVIPNSWLWLADNGNWMKPGEVHPNPAGYDRIQKFMSKHMRGESTDYGQRLNYPAPKAGINGDYSYWVAGRDGNYASIGGVFRVPNAIPVDTELGQLDYGLWPISEFMLPVVSIEDRTVQGTIIFFPSGLIRSFSGLPAKNYEINATWRVF